MNPRHPRYLRQSRYTRHPHNLADSTDFYVVFKMSLNDLRRLLRKMKQQNRIKKKSWIRNIFAKCEILGEYHQLLFMYLISIYLTLAIKIALLTFANETNFPFQCKHYKLLTPKIRGRSQLMVLIKVNPNHMIYIHNRLLKNIYI